jgi:hypothetical protein
MRSTGESAFRKTAKIKIVSFCDFNGTSIGAYKSITIGDHVGVGTNTVITDFDRHPILRQTEEMKSGLG